MFDSDWSPDIEVAVHGDDLIIKLDHLPAGHGFAAELDGCEMLIHSATPAGVEDHCFHLPLPAGLALGEPATTLRGEAFEVHMRVPTL